MSKHKALIHDVLEELNQSVKWLERSYTICQAIELINETTLSDNDYDAIEAFCSRYTRSVDLFTNKVLRLIDKLEYVEQGTMIDIINRAHKRGIIDSTDQLRILKDLRNRITHDYSMIDQLQLFELIRERTPELLQLIQKLQVYCEKNILNKI